MRESTIYFAEEAKTGVKILFREVKLKYFFFLIPYFLVSEDCFRNSKKKH